MPRFAAGIEYDGRAYSGWQFQPGLQTVQDAVQRALSRVADAPVECVCAGRTDAGVHASAQVVHFDTDAVRSERGWRLGTNSNLPDDVSVAWLREVPGHFHARYSAMARSYRYLILNRDSRSALAFGRATWERRPLDAQRMHTAAQVLIGEHDFSAFRAIECQAKSPLRRVERLEVTRDADWLTIAITANAFLHHMVRNIMGCLTMIGSGRRTPAWLADVMASRDRSRAAPTMAPDGLYFVGPYYDPTHAIPDRSRSADWLS